MNKPRNINDLLAITMKRFHEKTALVFDTKRISFSELGLLSKKAAKGLFNQGVRKGDRLALILTNCLEAPITLFGAMHIGAIPTFINAQHKGEDIFHALSNCEPKVLIVEDLLYSDIEEQVNRAKSVRIIYVVGGTEQKLVRKSQILPFESLLCEGDVHEDINEDDVAIIVNTAGTEGKPKGAMLSHKNIIRDIMDRESLVKVSSELKTLIFAPFFHIAGVRHLIMSSYRGNTIYVMPFKAEKALKIIEREKIGFIVGAPAVYHLLFRREDFDKYDLSSLKVVGVGGAPSTPDLVTLIFEKFPNALIYNGYGQTEITGGNIVNIGDDFIKRPESVGKMVPGHELRIVNEEGNPVSTGKVGEVTVKGDCVFMGYWGMPEATSQKIRNGWLYTGDLGYLDEDGFLYLAGRKSDMIIRGGENIYPQEVENCLERHPAVEEAAIMGLPDKVMGEEVKAFIQLKKGVELTEDELRDFSCGRIAKFKVPKYFEFIEEIPHIAAGKIDRKALRKREPFISS